MVVLSTCSTESAIGSAGTGFSVIGEGMAEGQGMRGKASLCTEHGPGR